MLIVLLHLPRPPGGSRKLYRNPLKGSTFWILPLVLSLKRLLPLEAVWAFKLGLGMGGGIIREPSLGPIIYYNFLNKGAPSGIQRVDPLMGVPINYPVVVRGIYFLDFFPGVWEGSPQK